MPNLDVTEFTTSPKEDNSNETIPTRGIILEIKDALNFLVRSKCTYNQLCDPKEKKFIPEARRDSMIQSNLCLLDVKLSGLAPILQALPGWCYIFDLKSHHCELGVDIDKLIQDPNPNNLIQVSQINVDILVHPLVLHIHIRKLMEYTSILIDDYKLI